MLAGNLEFILAKYHYVATANASQLEVIAGVSHKYVIIKRIDNDNK